MHEVNEGVPHGIVTTRRFGDRTTQTVGRCTLDDKDTAAVERTGSSVRKTPGLMRTAVANSSAGTVAPYTGLRAHNQS